MEQNETALDAARREIDAADAEMARLFCRRMDAVRTVAAFKKEHGLPVADSAREQAVTEKNLARLPCAAYAEYYREFIRHTMALSRAFQNTLLAQEGFPESAETRLGKK